MLKVTIIVCALATTWGHEFPRAPRIRFPSSSSDLYSGPRILGAESQSHPVYQESSSGYEQSFHSPYTAGAPHKHSSSFVDGGELSSYSEGPHSKQYLGQHRSPPRPREGQYHDQPPPYRMTVPKGSKLKGVLNAPPPPPPTTMIDGNPHKHRFSTSSDLYQAERRPSNSGHPVNERPSSYHHEKHVSLNGRHPGHVRDEAEGGERHRIPSDRPHKGDRHHSRDRSPTIHKEKVKESYSGDKKPLFNPSFTNGKLKPKVPTRFIPIAPHPSNVQPPTPEEESNYYQSKLNSEYYTGMQQAQFAEAPVTVHGYKPPQQTAQPKPSPVYDFDESYNFDNIPNFGAPANMGIAQNQQFPASMFPQSGEFADFFDTSLPEWMNDFKTPPAGNVPQNQASQQRVQNTRNEFGHGYFKQEPQTFEQGPSKTLNKRNPVQSPPSGDYFESQEGEEKRIYPKYRDSSDARPDSFYDSDEFDFSSSTEYSTRELPSADHRYDGQEAPKSPGTEWIPINAPNGAIPAKSYDIPAPDLSREYLQNPNPFENKEIPTRSPQIRARTDEAPEAPNSSVVYGARSKKRKNEGVVSASVMVKQ